MRRSEGRAKPLFRTVVWMCDPEQLLPLGSTAPPSVRRTSLLIGLQWGAPGVRA